jgi:Protein of unknown function (DUF3102)
MARNQRVHWAKQISAAWRSSIEGIFKCGRLLIKAKEKLDHGQFAKMIEHDLPFGERSAQRLMAIARDSRLTNPTHASLLPQSWMTLFELSRLSDAHFSAALADGHITPDMQRGDVQGIIDFCEAAERQSQRATTMAAERSLNTCLPPLRPADRIETVTLRDCAVVVGGVGALKQLDLSEHIGRHSARIILEALLVVEREGAKCHELTPIVELALSSFNRDKLERIQRAIAFAIRLKGALDQAAGHRGNPTLQLINNRSEET